MSIPTDIYSAVILADLQKIHPWLEHMIMFTPTGDIRNLLCEANIILGRVKYEIERELIVELKKGNKK